MSNYRYWADHIAGGRNKYDRPVANNTRARLNGYASTQGESVSIRFHATDIVTFWADGAIEVNHGGWGTITTLARIREFSPAKVSSVKGDWFIPFEHDPKDPPPQASTERTIPKPFHAPDPGPEPVDDGVGCVAGTSETFELQEDTTAHKFEPPERYAGQGFPLPNDDYGREHGHRKLRVTAMHTITYGAESWGGYGEPGEYKQCPHCKAFSELHTRWAWAMNGHPYYHRSEASAHGYAVMVEMLETYGSHEAWQDAYITEYREVRANRKALKAWSERNMCPFNGRTPVTASGHVPLRLKREHVKRLRASERAEQKRKRTNAQHARELAEREQRRAEEKRVRGLMAEALAESLFTGVETKRPEWHAVKAKNLQEVS